MNFRITTTILALLVHGSFSVDQLLDEGVVKMEKGTPVVGRLRGHLGKSDQGTDNGIVSLNINNEKNQEEHQEGQVDQHDARLLRTTGGTVFIDSTTQDIVATLRSEGLYMMEHFIQRGFLTSVILAGNFTLFAPNDAAFNALPGGVLNHLLRDSSRMARLARHHLVEDVHLSSNLASGRPLEPLEGPDIIVQAGSGTVYVDNALIVTPNITASNGAIHEIDQVLLPDGLIPFPDNIVEAASGESLISAFYDAVRVSGISDTLTASLLTVFAPTDEAFNRLPTKVMNYLQSSPAAMADFLLHHVAYGWDVVLSFLYCPGPRSCPNTFSALDGNTLTVDGPSPVTVNNVTVVKKIDGLLNGVIYAIDGILIPPGFTLPNIVELVNIDGGLQTLSDAIQVANLETALSNGTFTLFAPDDAAFSAFANTTLSFLFDANNQVELRRILDYHIILGEYMVSSFGPRTTLGGLTIQNAGGNVLVNQARILSPDIMADNGVIHTIDKVLLPPSCEGTAACDGTGDFHVDDFSCQGDKSCRGAGNRGHFEASTFSCLKTESCLRAGLYGWAEVGSQSCIGTSSCRYIGYDAGATTVVGDHSCVGALSCRSGWESTASVQIGDDSCIGHAACIMDFQLHGEGVVIGNGSCQCKDCCRKLPSGSVIGDCQCNSLADQCGDATSPVIRDTNACSPSP